MYTTGFDFISAEYYSALFDCISNLILLKP